MTNTNKKELNQFKRAIRRHKNNIKHIENTLKNNDLSTQTQNNLLYNLRLERMFLSELVV